MQIPLQISDTLYKILYHDGHWLFVFAYLEIAYMFARKDNSKEKIKERYKVSTWICLAGIAIITTNGMVNLVYHMKAFTATLDTYKGKYSVD